MVTGCKRMLTRQLLALLVLVSLPSLVSAKAIDNTKDLYLELETSRTEVMVGAQLLLTVRALSRLELSGMEMEEPEPHGMKTEVYRLGQDRTYARYSDGYTYTVVEKCYALFPLQPGTLSIAPLLLTAEIGERPSLSSTGDGYRQLKYLSRALEIDVLPRPEDLGNRPWIPADGVLLKDDWQKTQPALRLGEPTERTFTLDVAGFSATRLPELRLNPSEGWKIYQDKFTRTERKTATGVLATLQQKVFMVPTRSGSLRLPAIELEWYDTFARKWQVCKVEARTVHVAVTSDSIHPILQNPATGESTAGNLLPVGEKPVARGETFWPWLSLGLGLGWLATLYLLARQYRLQKQKKKKIPPPTDNEHRVRQQLLEAAEANNPVQAQHALDRWIHVFSSSRKGQNPFQSLPFRHAVDALNRALYGQEPVQWDGSELASAVRNLEQAKPKPTGMLPNLYPKN
ncbi:MAG: hypothetical protein CSB34_03390 [Desulfobulbus propionicus]|nr:MAG: hypothetical protein CSB34_03390 [Desulfobulbus propionicus]